MRKIIQVATSEHRDNSDGRTYTVTTALCDDGTVWRCYGTTGSWKEIGGVPQPEAQTDERITTLFRLLREARTWMNADTGFMIPQEAKAVREKFNSAIKVIDAAIAEAKT